MGLACQQRDPINSWSRDNGVNRRLPRYFDLREIVTRRPSDTVAEYQRDNCAGYLKVPYEANHLNDPPKNEDFGGIYRERLSIKIVKFNCCLDSYAFPCNGYEPVLSSFNDNRRRNRTSFNYFLTQLDICFFLSIIVQQLKVRVLDCLLGRKDS